MPFQNLCHCIDSKENIINLQPKIRFTSNKVLVGFIKVADDLTELAGTVAGPPDTPYAGGKFKLEIKIPDTYPFNPPKVIFLPQFITT